MSGAAVRTTTLLHTRPLSLFILTSLDGKIARTNGEIDWIWTKPVEGPNSDCGFGKFMSTVSHIVTGRKTFDVSLAHEENPFAGKKKIVFTRDPLRVTGEATSETVYTNDDPVSYVQRLKETSSDDCTKIWLLGGAELVKQLYEAGLIDEIILTVQPIIIGPGISLFGDLDLETHWNLRSVESWKEGLVQMTFNRAT